MNCTGAHGYTWRDLSIHEQHVSQTPMSLEVVRKRVVIADMRRERRVAIERYVVEYEDLFLIRVRLVGASDSNHTVESFGDLLIGSNMGVVPIETSVAKYERIFEGAV